MQSSQEHNQKGQTDHGSGEFFVPDLCGARPVFVMVMLAELLVMVHALADTSLPQFDWDLLAIGSLFVQWVVLLSAALLCLLRNSFARMSLSLAASACLFIILAVTALGSYLAVLFYPQLVPGNFSDSFADVMGSAGRWWIVRNIILASILGGITLRYFYLQQQLQLREKSELQARIDSLRSRIRPHFLFNTMNSIASLIASQPDAAERAVEDLSELFRASLQENNIRACVADELRLCELYLAIEQLRLGSRLNVEWHIDDATRQLAMPTLILQPLVENAVYHGIAQLPEGGTIVISLSQQGGIVRAIIENPIAEHASHTEGHHMALSNIEQRLQALFGAGGGMKITPVPGKFVIEIRYPPGEMT